MTKIVARILSMVVILTLLATSFAMADTAASGGTSVDPATLTGSISIMTWDTNTVNVLKQLVPEMAPNLKVEYIQLQNAAMHQKLATELASGVGAPDLCMVEASYFAQNKDNTELENLSDAPYGADSFKDEYLDYFWSLLVGSDNKLRLFPGAPGMGATFYRRDLAKQYLGTDDPAELEKLMPTMKDAFNVGMQIKEKSNGTVFMLDNAYSVFNDALNIQKQPFVDADGKIMLKDIALEPLKQAIEWRNAGLDAKLTEWTPAWGASFVKGDVFMYISGSWFGAFGIQANDADKASSGKWGVMATPGGTANAGGNSWCIPSSGKNKELAWNFLQSIVRSSKFEQAYLTYGGCLSAQKSRQNDPMFSMADPYFGGQDVNVKFYELAANITAPPSTLYDTIFNTLFGTVIVDAINGKYTAEEAIDHITQEAVSQASGEIHP